MTKERFKKICQRCISDETIPGISFDGKGICNYCRTHEKLDKEFPTGKQGLTKLKEIVRQIKEAGKGKKYDCIVGVSGGCDSSYLLYMAKEKFGLRPLAVHFDNTWNSDIATQNIYLILKKLKIDLYTHVVNNEEYDDIYHSFLISGVKDVDVPTDIGLITTLYQAADKYGIKYLLDGHSFRTEGIVPTDFVYMDGKYIESVQKKYGSKPLDTYPNLWLKNWLKWLVFSRIKRIRPLYYLDYNKEETKKMLNKKFGWQWYGGHHNENRYTLFVVNYFLPKRFGIDFRMIEFSGLIRSGQMTRQEALRKIQEPKLIDDSILNLVKKRIKLTNQELKKIIEAPPKTYRDFKTYKPLFEKLRPLFWLMYKINLVPQSFYMKYTKKTEKR